MKKLLQTISVTAFALLFLSIPVFALEPAPLRINFQGKLTEPSKAPIGLPVDITFSIFDVGTGGSALWSEDHTGITVTDGIFNVLIGSGTPNPANTGDLSTVFTGEDRWLEVQVGSDPAMTPRQRIVSVPYSIHSNTAVNADDVNNKDINPNSVTIPAFGTVINSDGKWVGDPTDLKGPQGPTGAIGATGPQGPKGDSGASGCNWLTLALMWRRSWNNQDYEAYWAPVSWIGTSNSHWRPFNDAGDRRTVCTR